METRSKASGGSEPLKKEIGVAIWQFGEQKFSNFLHARHRATNTILGLRSMNARRNSLSGQTAKVFPLTLDLPTSRANALPNRNQQKQANDFEKVHNNSKVDINQNLTFVATPIIVPIRT